MADKKFKYVHDGYKAGMPAHINFYSDVCSWSAQDFVGELHYLEEYVQPSEIVIHVNSSGGCVVDGISVFAAIQNCKIKVKTINEGLAASMGSIIWAAADELYMKDYSLLMIHNPFMESESNDADDIVGAFKKQLKIIYSKRFGLDDETIEKIMNGEEGKDGTWFTAEEAVAAGFLSADHIVETPSAVKEQIAASVKGIKDLQKISTIMGTFTSETVKDKDNKNINLTNNKMDKELMVVAGLLDMTSDKATENNITARIKDLLNSEKNLKTVTGELDKAKSTISDLTTQLNGQKASVENLTKNLSDAQAELKVYKDAEAAAKKAEIEALVEAAIKDGKIAKESKDAWISQAEANLELVKTTLASIPARVEISKEIASDVQNNAEAQAGVKSEEEKLNEQVKAIVGDKFEYHTFKR